MIEWVQQGEATVGGVTLDDGRPARIVLVGDRHNPKGAMVVISASANKEVQTATLNSIIEHLPHDTIVQALCMQERRFGPSGLDIGGLV